MLLDCDPKQIALLWVTVPSKSYTVDATVDSFKFDRKTPTVQLFFKTDKELVLKAIALNQDWNVVDKPVMRHHAVVNKFGAVEINSIQYHEFTIRFNEDDRRKYNTMVYAIDQAAENDKSGLGTPLDLVTGTEPLIGYQARIHTLDKQDLRFSLGPNSIGKEVRISNLAIEYPSCLSLDPSKVCPPLEFHAIYHDGDRRIYERYPANVYIKHYQPYPDFPQFNEPEAIHISPVGYKFRLNLDVQNMIAQTQ